MSWRPAWVWMVPVMVAVVARCQLDPAGLGIRALVGLGAVAIVARRPQTALLALVALLPLQELLLAAAFRLGLPAVLVRDLGFWKEVVVAGCVVAAVGGLRHQRWHLDTVDLLGLVYLGIVGLYYLFPRFFVHASGPSVVGPPTDSTTLSAALRNDTVFVVLLLAVRRLPFDTGFRRRLVATLYAIGAAVAAVGVLEFVFSDAWNRFIVSTLRVPEYLSVVLKVAVRNPRDIRVFSQVAGHSVPRVGSVFLDQLGFGLYLVIVLGIGLERAARGDRRLVIYLTTAVVGVAIVLTQTRAALIAAIVVIAWTLRPSIERTGRARARYSFIVAAGLVAMIPLAIGTGMATRASGSVTGEESAQLHIDRSKAGVQALIAAPLGRGLGTGNTNGTRFFVATSLNAEDYYLQVGNETGVLSMAVFIALILALNRRLSRRARRGADVLLSSWRGVFLGLSLACLFDQVWWLGLALAWTVWAGLGICLTVPAVRPTGRAQSSAPDMRHYLLASTRRWPLILVTMAAAVLVTHRLPAGHRRFSATSTLVVGLRQLLAPPASPGASRDLIAGLDRQRRDYAVTVAQLPMAADAALRTGVARAPATIAGEMRALAPPGTQLLRITVTDPDPVVARSLADGLADSLIAAAPGLQQPNRLAAGATEDLSISLSDPAVVPSTAVPDRRRARLVDAAVLSLLAAVAAAVLAEYLAGADGHPDPAVAAGLRPPRLAGLGPPG